MCRLRQSPQKLAELEESLKLLESLQGNLAKTEAQIPLIHEQFAILDKYEVPMENTVCALLVKKIKNKLKMSSSYGYIMNNDLKGRLPAFPYWGNGLKSTDLSAECFFSNIYM